MCAPLVVSTGCAAAAAFSPSSPLATALQSTIESILTKPAPSLTNTASASSNPPAHCGLFSAIGAVSASAHLFSSTAAAIGANSGRSGQQLSSTQISQLATQVKGASQAPLAGGVRSSTGLHMQSQRLAVATGGATACARMRANSVSGDTVPALQAFPGAGGTLLSGTF